MSSHSFLHFKSSLESQPMFRLIKSHCRVSILKLLNHLQYCSRVFFDDITAVRAVREQFVSTTATKKNFSLGNSLAFTFLFLLLSLVLHFKYFLLSTSLFFGCVSSNPLPNRNTWVHFSRHTWDDNTPPVFMDKVLFFLNCFTTPRLLRKS